MKMGKEEIPTNNVILIDINWTTCIEINGMKIYTVHAYHIYIVYIMHIGRETVDV